MNLLLIVLIVLVVIAIIAYLETFLVQIREFEIKSDKIKKDYYFILISDLHFHSGFTNLKLKIIINSLANIFKKYSIEGIFFTGDFIDNATGLKKLSIFLKELKNKKCYGVFGNHDYWDYNVLHFFYPIFSKIDKKKQDIKNLKKILEGNIKILINESIENDEFIIYGLDYNSKLVKFDFSNKKLKILLSHYPEVIELYKEKVDLILSGHTHGGQLTFFGIPIVVRSKLKRKWISGISKHSSTKLIVTKGVGESFYVPFRLFSRPEVVLLKLTGGKDES